MAENERHFNPDMTIAEAIAIHPRVAEVFAAFHLGGCAHCHINQVETLDQVCMAYGIDPDMLMEVLEDVVKDEEQSGEATKA